MTPPSSPSRSHHTTPLPFFDSINRSFESLTTTVFSRLPFVPVNPNPIPSISNPSSIGPPLSSPVTVPFLLPPLSFPSHYRTQSQGQASPSSAIRSFSSNVRIDGLSSKGGGPAFVGQVFSMLDPSGNGLMAVTTHFDIPFISKRTPNWIKKMLAMVTKSEQNGPVFRFFMDLSDAVEYVKRLNVPTGMVGACRLDVAYEHFKEKPHMFQFVPNKKQVKAANELLKRIPLKHGRRKLVGVPVFTAQNLNIAIATNDGIKWYTPYFFDKNLLDNILEASFDQHFHALIQNRHTQRRRDVIDDSLTAEVIEENGDGLFDPPEVREVLDEIGHQDIPLSVISKAAEIKLLDVVDKMLLGNKWMRKASGIQPKFPYLVDSFEERSASAFVKDAARASSASGAEVAGNDPSELQQLGASELDLNDYVHGGRGQPKCQAGFQFPFGRWFANPRKSEKTKSDMRTSDMDGDGMERPPVNPLLPKITMVGISMGEGGQVSRANLKKTMEDLTEELKESQKASKLDEDKDPLFVANVGDYSSITRMDAS